MPQSAARDLRWDTRRQRELDAGRHLLDCGTCATLSEPLSRRSAALTALIFPAAIAARVLAKARAHPVQAAASTAGTAAVTAAAIAGALASGPAPAVHRPAAVPAPLPTISGLVIGERAVSSRRSIRAAIGEHATASGVSVESAVTRNGLWVGTPTLRVWVELVGPLEPLHIAANSHLDFDGLLNSQGAHIEVRTTDIRVERNS